jgi:hypothetical protein
LTEPKIFFAREPNIESLQNSRMQEIRAFAPPYRPNYA